MEHSHEKLLAILDAAMPFLQALSEEEATSRPSPGKWSKKEIIGHLIDSAGNNHQRFVRMQIAPGGHLEWAGYAQDEWVSCQHYQQAEWKHLLVLWLEYNLHIAHVMRHCPPEKLANTISIGGKVSLRLDFIMSDYVEHLKHHLHAVLPFSYF